MEWQRYVWDVSQEINPETGLRQYRTVVLVVPRQCGKSTGIDAQLVHGALRAPDTTSLYMAQSQEFAGRRLIDDVITKKLDRSGVFRGRYRPYRARGNQRINWRNGSITATGANNATAGHGLTLNGDAILDEAFAHTDFTSMNAVSPTMITCPDPQLWVASCVGDGTDQLVEHFQDIGSAAVLDPESTTAYFEWSAEDDAPHDDPATWRATIPALGHTITEDRVREELIRLGPADFGRSYLCRRPTAAFTSKIDPTIWARQARPMADAMPIAPLVLVADVAHDRSAASITVVASTGNPEHPTELVGIVDRRAGTSWLVPELRRLQRARRPAAIVGDRRSPLGSLFDRMEAALGPILEPDANEFARAGGLLLDELDDGAVVHIGQDELTAAAGQARHRPVNDLWCWDRRHSPVDLSPLTTLTLGVWAHRKLYPTPERGRIY